MILNFANNATLNAEEMSLVKKTNLLIDTSGRAITNMADFINNYGRDKFAFGTHAPILDYLTGQLRIESLRDTEADAATKEMLRSENAKRQMGI